MADGERLHGDPHGSEDSDGSPADDASGAVVEAKIVSPRGARVTETVFVLSSRASRQLEIRGEIPACRVSGSGFRPSSSAR
jgi:hypothetical protein